MKRAIVAIPFLAALLLAARLNTGPVIATADATRPGFSLRDETVNAGLGFAHQRPTFDRKIANVEPHVAALGASVSVGDFDADGWPDLYFTNSRFGSFSALFRNRQNGTFEDVATRFGLADVSRPGEGVAMGSVWGDYDNDGREDLLVYRYGYLALYKNEGTRFRDVSNETGVRRWVNSNGAIWLDYDRDGQLDLYVTAYFRDDVDLWRLTSTRIMHNSFEFATNGGKNLLFRNVGGRFVDVTDQMGGGVGSTRWTLAAASADFNDDGWPDIYLANDYGPEELFLNEAGKRFRLTTAGLESESKSGMSVSLGDVFNRGRLDVFVTNISERGYIFQNNNLRANQLAERGKFANVADAVVADAGWAWGAQFGDFNNDGTNELFVTNGFISADSTRTYWYAMSKIAGAHKSLFEDAASWPPFGNLSLSGYELSRVYLNRGLAGWTDVAASVGVRDRYDGRAVALADLANRGALDVIVANQNQPAILYRTYPDSANNWIAFNLAATKSNRSAIGAEITVETPGLRQRKVVDGGMGFASQNDRRPHFGLGKAQWVERVVIRWPSGEQQVLHNLAVNQFHVVTEPKR